MVLHHLREDKEKVVQVWVVFQVLVSDQSFHLWGTLEFLVLHRKEFRCMKAQGLPLQELKNVRRIFSRRVRSGYLLCLYPTFRSGRNRDKKRFCVFLSTWASSDLGLHWPLTLLHLRLRVRFGILKNFTWVVWSQPNSWGQVDCWRCCNRFSRHTHELGCRAEKAQITVLLPSGSDLNTWLDKVDCMSHSWPKSCNIGLMQADKVHAKTSTCIVSSQEPGTSGSHWDPTGSCWDTICILSGQVSTLTRNSMIDCFLILDAMTTFTIHHREFGGILRSTSRGCTNKCSWLSLLVPSLVKSHWLWKERWPILRRILQKNNKKSRPTKGLRALKSKDGRPNKEYFNWKIRPQWTKLKTWHWWCHLCRNASWCLRGEKGCYTLYGLFDWGEPLRVALRVALWGNRSLFHRFTAVDLDFFLGVLWFAWFLFGFCRVCFCFCLFFHDFEINLVVLRSWTTVWAVMARTAWGKKKKTCVSNACIGWTGGFETSCATFDDNYPLVFKVMGGLLMLSAGCRVPHEHETKSSCPFADPKKSLVESNLDLKKPLQNPMLLGGLPNYCRAWSHWFGWVKLYYVDIGLEILRWPTDFSHQLDDADVWESEMLFAKEVVLRRVRYVSLSRAVSPRGCCFFLGGCCVVVWLVCFVFAVVSVFVLFVFLSRFSRPSGCDSFHTEAVKLRFLSIVNEGTRSIRGDYSVSLSDSSFGLPVSQRSAPVCE